MSMVDGDQKDLIAASGLMVGTCILVIVVFVFLMLAIPEIMFTLLMFGLLGWTLYGLHRWWKYGLNTHKSEDFK